MARPSARRTLTVGDGDERAVDAVIGHARRARVHVGGVVVDDDADGAGLLAFRALTAKPQKPRSISAMLPAIAAALVNGEQPSVAVPAAARSEAPPVRWHRRQARRSLDVGVAQRGSECGVPNWYTPATAAGASTRSSGLPKISTCGTSAVTLGPFHDHAGEAGRRRQALRVGHRVQSCRVVMSKRSCCRGPGKARCNRAPRGQAARSG